jgi:hypothetical protein
MAEILLGRDFDELLLHTDLNAHYDEVQRNTDALTSIQHYKGVDDPLIVQENLNLNGRRYELFYKPQLIEQSRPYYGFDARSDTTLHYATINKLNDVAGTLIKSKDLYPNKNIQISKSNKVDGIIL